MIIKKIEINNFKTFKNNTVEMKEKNPNFICGKNGSGKSTVLEAIMWCFNKEKLAYNDEQIINIDVFKETNEGFEINVSVTIFCLDMDNCEYKVERINTYKKTQSKALLINESLDIHRIYSFNGKAAERKLQSNDLIDELAKCIFEFNGHDLSNLGSDLCHFISNKYRVNLNTAISILELIVKNSNVIFKDICKKPYIRMIRCENKEIELIDENGFVHPGGMADICECIYAILLALKEFDNDICIVIDDLLNYLDCVACRWLIDYLSKIEYQIILVTSDHQGHLFPEINKFICCNVENNVF